MDLQYEVYLRGDISFWSWQNTPGVTTIEQRFLEQFATALIAVHLNQVTEKFTDEEVRKVFSELPKQKAFEYLTKLVPKEVQQQYPGNHMNWFNVEKVTAMLGKAGFTEIWESRYLQSRCPIMRNPSLFDSTYPQMSLYVECRKQK